MKKTSELYKLAQCAVLHYAFGDLTKLEILRELMNAENLADFREKQEEKEATSNA